MDVTDLLARAVAVQASDLHLAAGQTPMLRLDGELQRMAMPPLAAGALVAGMATLLDDTQREQWAQGAELDLALALPALGRFRVNLFRQLNGPAATFRLIPGRIATLDELALTDVFQAVVQYRDGLVLVGGPTGSGKSSTLATLLDQLNREKALHIITLEDPVEVIHSSQRSLVNQREVGRHSSGFAQGLRSALRQDPDVIMIGELRDLETIRLALQAAETGHLVLATVHARSAASSIERLVEVFAADEKPLVRAMLAESLQMVVAQVLVRRVGGGRVAAREVLVATPAVRNLVREGRMAQLCSVMQAGGAQGMRTMEGALRGLREKGLVDD
ncbi:MULTISPECIES: type IV pilus twitching motility protein PilT [Pseudomonas]|jgi:twitching motility protein PilT|uniref:type IV pilus twitching motility protein PilT n=1 Tax=Pseudomonas TaxID=286 RepID=UPI00063F2BDD|nr:MULTISPECIES: PilT/PilU family type 4a pilus ATPase [Pseudomonas]KLJ14678.1 twitching motility protein PilT [Pseudomonas sp. TJI-51]MBA6121024.1 PilT/PilU family type 4a pilus ATPase [Pseudomonas juntendi]MBI6912799.1 PilT/PilU family type 4a pilus ATPase [Pseudomonas juntendi]MCF3155837.1 PilT/PilU family type 4a pilus ATPase [Pseudomonas juntendi]MCQ1989310.1 PilT/PilU family type 4a pilus ATPase [Pseudomonas sp. Eb3]